MKYTVRLSLDDRYKDNLKKHLKAVEDARNWHADFEKRVRDFNTAIAGLDANAIAEYQQTHPNPMNEQMTPEEQQMLADAQSNFKSRAAASVAQECPALNRKLLLNVFDAQTPLENYLDDVDYSFTETIAMIRTDHGWQEAR